LKDLISSKEWRLTEGHFNLCSKKIESIVDKALSLYKEGFAPSDKGRFRYSHRYWSGDMNS